jgi:release factor glutamine methyltransferase
MQVLLAHVTGRNRAWVLAHPEAVLTPAQEQTFLALKARLDAGEPLPYLIGHWEFYGLDFDVTPDVLIPRPETELLIDSVLAWARERSAAGAGLRLIDIGTGSGCIAVTLAARLPQAEIWATDLSAAALAIARRNAAKHGVTERITFREADLFPADLPPLDLILSNPPYIPTPTLHGLAVYGREPTLALDGGPDGLAIIRRLLAESKRYLAPGGAIRIEIESGQGKTSYDLACSQYPGAQKIHIIPDLAGLDRLLAIDT